MKTNERQDTIMSLLRERRFLSVSELSNALYISPSSIRRDLTHLQQAGLVRRSYGGVILSGEDQIAPPTSVRMESHKAEKKQIAKQAATLLRDNVTIFLDGSTTAYYLCDYLAPLQEITVFTNNLTTASCLRERSVNTYCIGGYLLKGSHVAVGSYAEEMLSNLHADLCFFSSFALSDDGVISDCTAEENALRKRMLEHSDCRVFLCDSSKFHRSATHRLCTTDEVDFCFYNRPIKDA